MATGIEWTDETWNPVRGCALVSPGCTHCYAMEWAHGLRGYEGLTRMTEHGPVWTGAVRLVPEALDKPRRWKKPRMVFVNSMSDLFYERIPFEFIERVFTAMVEEKRHTFQVLTKRAARLRELAPRLPWSANVWMGVSVEAEDYTVRIDDLRATPARIKFLSLEPLLGPLPNLDLSGIQWAIIGGESGSGARPLAEDWARDLVAQCHTAGVAIFVKQLGSVWARAHGSRDRKGKVMDDWPPDLRIREYPPTVRRGQLDLFGAEARDASEADHEEPKALT